MPTTKEHRLLNYTLDQINAAKKNNTTQSTNPNVRLQAQEQARQSRINADKQFGQSTFTGTATGLLHYYMTVRTSTTARWAGALQTTSATVGSFASSDLTIATSSTIAVAIQGQQTSGAETSHTVEQFAVIVHKALSTQ